MSGRNLGKSQIAHGCLPFGDDYAAIDFRSLSGKAPTQQQLCFRMEAFDQYRYGLPYSLRESPIRD